MKNPGKRMSAVFTLGMWLLSLYGFAHNVPGSDVVVGGGTPRVCTLDGKALVKLKKDIAQHPDKYKAALDQLKRAADEHLAEEPYTITKKVSLPPSGDKHDYESQGPYWWPDPKSKDGLPYIRRDGERNPEITKLTDHTFLSRMEEAVKTLSLAYFLTGNEAYAKKTRAFLRTWFIEPDTRMNPNLRYGQRIPGITDGRGIGIIETRELGVVADAVGLIQDSKTWTKEDQRGMEDWMRQYLDWLLHSENGKDEADEHNNHGTWYDVQVASLALFTGQEDIARQTLIRSRDERLPKHIDLDGRQPFELARTRSWSYSLMNLQSFFTLATLGEKIGVDLWHYATPDGRSIVKALDYLMAFSDASHPWPYKQITDRDPAQLVPLLRQAACRFPEGGYAALAEKLEGGQVSVGDLYYVCD
jgi:hypothetical protein